MKLSIDERIFIDKVSAISGVDVNTVRRIFSSALTAVALDIHSKKTQITIPFLFSIILSPKVNVSSGGKISADCDYRFLTNKGLQEFLNQILREESNVIEMLLQKDIEEKISSILST